MTNLVTILLRLTKFLLVAALLPVALKAQSVYATPYTMTLFAGQPGSIGTTDGTGTAARFYNPEAMAIDGSGNLYVADATKSTIRKITPAGVVTTFAGSPDQFGYADGTGSAASFGIPFGVAADAAGNIYVSDYYYHTIRKITPARVVTTLAGWPGLTGSTDGTGTDARFNEPIGLTVDPSGNVYVGDTVNNTIRKITPAGVVTTFAGTAGPGGSTDGTGTAARFLFPNCLAADSAGNVWVGDNGNYTIRKITPGGVVTTFAGAVGSSGSTDGTGSAARFYATTGVAVDGLGNLYVIDSGNSTIRKISPGAVVTTLAGLVGVPGATDGTGSSARFHYPAGIVVDAARNIFVCEEYNASVRRGVPTARIANDFSGDNKSDLIWSNNTTGERAMWLMNGGTVAAGASLGTVPTAWKIVGTGDFDGNGKADVVLFNTTTGDRAMWLMNGPTIATNIYLGNISTAWTISVVGDFNGDGKSDIFWSNSITGDRSMWLMNGGTVTTGAYLGAVPVAWKVSGAGDFNNDGKSDIVWTNTTTGDRSMWLMNGTTLSVGASLGNVPVAWKFSRVGDFNGDGKADIALSNTSTGDRAMWLMNASTISSNLYLGNVATAWTISSTGDFNGDGKFDIFWSNTGTGDRSMWLMNGGTVTEGAYLGSVPVEWVNPP